MDHNKYQGGVTDVTDSGVSALGTSVGTNTGNYISDPHPNPNKRMISDEGMLVKQ